jgi:hypothetical protein
MFRTPQNRSSTLKSRHMSKITLCLSQFCLNRALQILSQSTFKGATSLWKIFLKDTALNTTMLTRPYPFSYQHQGIAHQQPHKTKIKSTSSPRQITTLIRRTQIFNKRRSTRGNEQNCNDLPTKEVSALSRRANPMRRASNRILYLGQVRPQSNIRIHRAS